MPRIEPATSWFLVGFVSASPRWELLQMRFMPDFFFFSCGKIHIKCHFNHFYMCIFLHVQFSCINYYVHNVVCSHHDCLFPERFHHPKQNLCYYMTTPILFPPPPRNHFLLCLYELLCISAVIQYLSFCVWLISFSIMFSRFIHVVACVSTSFLFQGCVMFIICIYRIVFIHSSFDGHMDCSTCQLL